jgi:hypothetical protein
MYLVVWYVSPPARLHLECVWDGKFVVPFIFFLVPPFNGACLNV